ncbi:hypothetical protein [Flavobacterium sp. MMS24-S5]|uniref:hypothetical protein n=1 Tax=Flavobacterium sp. MMS24-S5 TaxID=3416605 RepID=UPI003D03E5E9
MTETIAKRERHKTNQAIVGANNEAVLKIKDKNETDKIMVLTLICFPNFKPKGRKANMTKIGT